MGLAYLKADDSANGKIKHSRDLLAASSEIHMTCMMDLGRALGSNLSPVACRLVSDCAGLGNLGGIFSNQYCSYACTRDKENFVKAD